MGVAIGTFQIVARIYNPSLFQNLPHKLIEIMTKTTTRTVLTIAILAAILSPAIAEPPSRSTKDLPPRKVIVGTVQQGFWGTYPGLEKRLEQLGGIIDAMAFAANKMHGRGLDLAVLPETAVTDNSVDDPAARSIPFQGTVFNYFAQKARQHGCYILRTQGDLDSTARFTCPLSPIEKSITDSRSM